MNKLELSVKNTNLVDDINGDGAYAAAPEGALKDDSGVSGIGRRRKRLRAAVIVPHPGPCLIDLWTGQVVARNAEAASANPPSSSLGKNVKVRFCR